MSRILVVDDEQDICEILQFNLETEGYEVETANSAEEAVAIINSCKEKVGECFDLLLLDVMMGELSGFKLARMLKADSSTSHIPIIFITALDNEDDMVKGLNIGADDYIAKPLSIKEVKARVKAVLRRAAKHNSPSVEEHSNEEGVIKYAGIVINTEHKTVSIDGQNVSFTRLEFDLLAMLMESQGKVFSREKILKRIWPDDVIVTDRAVDVTITRLRKKIGVYGKFIKTRVGFGYLFEK